MIISAMRVLGISVAAIAATAGGAAIPAHAASTDGKVDSSIGIRVRYAPSTASQPLGAIADGKTIPIECKVRGTMVDGNDLWYSLPPNTHEWVSARYVKNVGPTPDWCSGGKVATGKATSGLNLRQGPTHSDKIVGSVAAGATIKINCKVVSDNVNGNDLWYYTTGGRWVTARYIDNIGAAPGYCADR